MQEGFPVSQRGGTAALHMTTSANDEAQSTAARPKEEGGGQDVLSGRTFHIRTFGCQMNEYDSDRMAESLRAAGMTETAAIDDADLILLNTCAVREKPSHKVVSLLGRFRPARKGVRPQRFIVAGCVAQHMKDELLKQVPWLDVVMGPDAICRLPDLAARAFRGERICDTSFARPAGYRFPLARPETVRGRASAMITVMKGCNNACTYCVVPRTRGRELSRPFEDVVEEVRGAVSSGVKEVMLVGQNVNSYAGGCTFAELIEKVHAVEGLRRIRFTTSNPQDLGQDLADAFSRLPKLMPSFHLPVQSGCDRVLERMRRRYTAAEYLEKLAMLRKACPGIALTTDIIAGFPGETAEDFEETIELVRRVRYENVYSFIFSPREGTPAALHEAEWGPIPHEEQVRRLEKLQALVRDISLEYAQAQVGRDVEVLVEGPSKTRSDRLMGHTPENRTVNFQGTAAVGDIVRVHVESASSNALFGRQKDS